MNEKQMTIGAGVAAFFASLCCIAPLLAVFFGVSLVSAGFLVFVEGLRPYLVLVTLLLIGAAGYGIYIKKWGQCDDPACPPSATWKSARVLFWIVGALAALHVSLPYWISIFLK